MHHRNTKIVATLGSSSNTRAMIHRLAVSGVNVFRLNMSHGRHDVICDIHRSIREVEEDLGAPNGILGDLQGPTLRCGTFAGGASIRLKQCA